MTRFGRLAAGLVAIAVASAGLGETVQGVVLGLDGKPSVGVPVWLVGDPRGTVKTATGRSGKFCFDPSPPFCLAVVAKPAGSAVDWVSLRPYEGGSFTLRAGPPAVMRGKVLGPDGKAVAGATVVVRALNCESAGGMFSDARSYLLLPEGLSGLSAETNRDGAFEIGGLPEDAEVSISARAPGLISSSGSSRTPIELSGFGPAELEVTRVKAGRGDVTLKLVKAANLTGQVKSEGKAQAGVDVRLSASYWDYDLGRALSDETGRYTIEAPKGKYRVFAVTKDGRLSAAGPCNLEFGRRASVDVEFLPPIMVDGPDGKAARVKVELLDNAGKVLETVDLEWAADGKPLNGRCLLVGGAVKARLKAAFGPFEVVPVEVAAAR